MIYMYEKWNVLIFFLKLFVFEYLINTKKSKMFVNKKCNEFNGKIIKTATNIDCVYSNDLVWFIIIFRTSMDTFLNEKWLHREIGIDKGNDFLYK